jgi:hypothetical protein
MVLYIHVSSKGDVVYTSVRIISIFLSELSPFFGLHLGQNYLHFFFRLLKVEGKGHGKRGGVPCVIRGSVGSDGHVPPGRSRILLRQCAQTCAVQILMVVPCLHSQSVVICQMNIPLSVIRAGDIIH